MLPSIMLTILGVKMESLKHSEEFYGTSVFSDVIMIGQKVKVKMKNEFVSAVVVFVSKLASNSTYFYATAKIIVRLPDGSTPEFQFRELFL